MILQKSGDTSSADASNFYGQNAALVVQNGAANVQNLTVETDAEGANAVFATGEQSRIAIEGVTIRTQKDSSRGLDATYGGTIVAQNVDITTQGAHSAALATDRGEGKVTVTNGTLRTTGDGSPCIYSTGTITANHITGSAAGSQCAVVEGKNSIVLQSSTLSGAGENGVMLYQSTSGDAAEGTAVFTAWQSTLRTTSDGPMFYVTNTHAEMTLQQTELSFDSGVLVRVSGNSTNQWGTPGQNGGQLVLNATSQTLVGDLVVDEISTLQVNLQSDSMLTGAVNAAYSGKEVNLNPAETAVWKVTEDSYLTVLTNALSDCTNIQSNGHNVYYDATHAGNAWLNGSTIILPGGGLLRPIA